MTGERIRILNDRFRQTFSGGRIAMTAGVAALPDEVRAEVLAQVRTFKDFSPDNDPYGEHDFGGFELAGDQFFWKIDYYDEHIEFGSDDPANADKTTRVLTIMLASEY